MSGDKSCRRLKACKSLKIGRVGGLQQAEGSDPLVMVGIYSDGIAKLSNFGSNVQLERCVVFFFAPKGKHCLMHSYMKNESALSTTCEARSTKKVSFLQVTAELQT